MAVDASRGITRSGFSSRARGDERGSEVALMSYANVVPNDTRANVSFLKRANTLFLPPSPSSGLVMVAYQAQAFHTDTFPLSLTELRICTNSCSLKN